MSLLVDLGVAGHGLRAYEGQDIPRLCLLADDDAIWSQVTDLFPRPYDVNAAVRWTTRQQQLHPPQNLAIVGPDGLIGGIGVLLSSVPNYAHDGEVGYWLGRPFWGRGLATAALDAFVPWAARTHGLTRLTARVFAGNDASCRVLEKCGFALEGRLRQAAHKQGRELDVLVYGRLIPTVVPR
jgi:RimJ/RimL family protein N-acetyltransferase